MTNDYKTNLLEYLTGNLNNTDKSKTPYYETNTNESYSSTIYGNQSVECRDGKGNLNGKVLFYSHGGNKITLVDDKMNVLKVFTAFSTGTALRNILNLEVDETGNVYGLDYITSGGTTTYRIILMNNISEISKGESDYSIVLRNSYNVQGYTTDDDLSPTFETFLKKSTQSATYYFAIQDSTGTLLEPSTFQINVGSTNTWTRLEEITFINGSIEIGNIYFNTNDEPVAEYYATEYYGNYPNVLRARVTGSGAPTFTTIINNEESDTIFNPSVNDKSYSIKLIANYPTSFYIIAKGYYLAYQSGTFKTYKQRVKVLLVENEQVMDLYTNDSEDNFVSSLVREPIITGKVINECLFLYMFMEYTNDTQYDTISFNMITKNNNVNYYLATDNRLLRNQSSNAVISVSNVFNLYRAYLVYNNSTNYLITTKLVYSPLNYNGDTYTNLDSLVPLWGHLENSNNELVFARDLYNKKVYSNQVMSTLNVPNNLFNEEIISNATLIGSTNKELVESQINVEKNVYEDLYINFINALIMENQNEENHIVNSTGASRLNQSINSKLDYNSTKATKIRVNLTDSTSYITSATCTIENGVGTYSIGVHVPNDTNIQSIEIISNDELTTYQTINNLNLENNKYYIITQDVYVV